MSNKNLLTKLPDEIFRAVYKHIYDDAINDIKKMDYLHTFTDENKKQYCHRRNLIFQLYYLDYFTEVSKTELIQHLKLNNSIKTMIINGQSIYDLNEDESDDEIDYGSEFLIDEDDDF